MFSSSFSDLNFYEKRRKPVFVCFQYGRFTERALIIRQLHHKREGELTHKEVISIVIKNNEIIFNFSAWHKINNEKKNSHETHYLWSTNRHFYNVLDNYKCI